MAKRRPIARRRPGVSRRRKTPPKPSKAPSMSDGFDEPEEVPEKPSRRRKTPSLPPEELPAKVERRKPVKTHTGADGRLGGFRTSKKLPPDALLSGLSKRALRDLDDAIVTQGTAVAILNLYKMKSKDDRPKGYIVSCVVAVCDRKRAIKPRGWNGSRLNS